MNKRLIILPLLFAAGTASASTPQQDFFDSLKALCGKAFEGKVARSDSSDRRPTMTLIYNFAQYPVHVRVEE